MSAAALHQLYRRKARALARRPSFGKAAAAARVRLGGELACTVDEEGGGRVLAALPADEGGSGAAPHPGQLMRASVGACLAMGYRLWGARLGVSIDDVDVEVACDFDVRGQLGLAPGVAIGWQRIQLDVRIRSRAPGDDVRRVVETADRLSPMLANLSAAIERVHRLEIERPERG
jgi:uncharacterized OsmC-like protein